MNQIIENRREFLNRTVLGLVSIPVLLNCRNTSSAQIGNERILDIIRKNAITDDDCTWCGAKDVPNGTTWKTNLAKNDEEGESLIISGTVFESDGKTPAPGILIYFYHTDTNGLYGRNGQPSHGRFRGWLLTDEAGRYEFQTVQPASYPNSRNPAHIHMTVTSADHKEDWIDSILFDGDKFIEPVGRIAKKGGFNPVLKLEKSETGSLRGVRHIQLAKV